MKKIKRINGKNLFDHTNKNSKLAIFITVGEWS